MMTRPPFRLLFAIFKDMWRLLFLTSAVLITVLSFAICIKPLSDGKLEAGDLPKYMLLAMLPMLAYALPFAGAFAASLTYYRLATDNELTASQASGISLKRLLIPALVTGLVLGGTLLILNEQVIPRFLRNMERLITTDVPKMLEASVERGMALDLPDGTIIYADSAHRLTPDPDTGATDQLVLEKMVLINRDRDGNVTNEATANKAGIWVYPPEVSQDGTNRALSVVAITLLNSVATQRNGNSPPTLVTSAKTEVSLSVPNGFKDNPKFATFGELRALRTYPERLSKIDIKRRDLAFRIAERQMMQSLATSLEADHRVSFIREDEDETVIVRGSGLSETPQGWIVQPLTPGARIDVEIIRKGSRQANTAITRYAAQRVDLAPNPREERTERRLKLKLDAWNARAMSGTSVDNSLTAAPELPRYTRTDLVFSSTPINDLLKAPTADLLTRAQSPNTDAATRASSDDLRTSLKDLSRDITSKQNERLALAMTTLVIVITGAVTAVRLQSRLPLTVYLWAFFPALACVITIAGGQQLNRSIGSAGLLLLWSGVAVLILYTFRVYARLARN